MAISGKTGIDNIDNVFGIASALQRREYNEAVLASELFGTTRPQPVDVPMSQAEREEFADAFVCLDCGAVSDAQGFSAGTDTLGIEIDLGLSASANAVNETRLCACCDGLRVFTRSELVAGADKVVKEVRKASDMFGSVADADAKPLTNDKAIAKSLTEKKPLTGIASKIKF